MANHFRSDGKAASMPAGITAGVLIAAGITLAGGLILAWLVNAEHIAMSGIGYGAMLIQAASAATGAAAATGMVKHQHMLVAMSTSAAYFGVLLLVGLAFGGGFDAVGVTGITVLLGGGITRIPALIGHGNGVHNAKSRSYR